MRNVKCEMRNVVAMFSSPHTIKYFILIIALFTLLSTNLYAKFNYKQWLRDRKARTQYEQENYLEAEKLFRDNAIENPNVGQFHFNRGNALYKAEEYEIAQSEYQLALNDRNFTEKDKIFYNMGNIHFQAEEYDKALELYRRALIENSNNIDARKNYEMCKIIMEQQESDGGGDDQQEESENNEQSEGQQGQGESQPQPQQMEESPDKEEAERLLQAIEQKQEQEREKEPPTPGQPRGRYW